VEGAQAQARPTGTHAWLFLKADVQQGRWYACHRGEITARPDGTWDCPVTLGAASNTRIELRVGVVDDATHADLLRRLPPRDRANRVLYPEQPPGYLPQGFLEEARLVVIRE
jgi:hypothetical protein